MLTEVSSRLGSYCDSVFGKQRYATVLYGSRAYGTEHARSDLDIVTLCAEWSASQLEDLIRCVQQIHADFGLPLDNEVPFENKLLATWADVSDAISGKGFQADDGSLVLRPIEKRSDILTSNWLRLRLLLNALTGKVMVLAGDSESVHEIQIRARVGWFTLLPRLLSFSEFTIEDFVGRLICSENREGEEHLGFKDNPIVREYLKKKMHAAAGRCLELGTIREISPGSYRVEG